jgi:FkbM family methyltransferase
LGTIKGVVRHPFGLIKPLWFEPIKHLYRFITEDAYRALCIYALMYGNKERYRNFEIHYKKWKIKIPDSISFLHSFQEIFVRKLYEFQSTYDCPIIMDLGANIGLSVLFFKSNYPNSTIIALEPDPLIFKYLEENIKNNGYSDIVLLQKAAWTKDEKIRFFQEGSDGGRISIDTTENAITVDAIKLGALIEKYKPVFLKMDIEGAEAEVLIDCKNNLGGIKWLFVEYHSRINSTQNLDIILEILKKSGFRVHLSPTFSSPAPFMKIMTQCDYDMQINIFAWRQNQE